MEKCKATLSPTNLFQFLTVTIVGVVLSGCSPKADGPATAGTGTTPKESKTLAAAVETVQKTEAGHQICFQCKGNGVETCRASGCSGGKVVCPAPCLKLTVGKWEHLEVAGHKPDELWRKFYHPAGGWQAWNQDHVGEMVELQQDKYVITGKCKTCAGKATVPCLRCKGTARVECSLCDGKKSVPTSWTATDNPKLNNDPDRMKLADGRVINGKIVIQSETKIVVRTRDGKFIDLKPGDILPKGDSP